MAGACADRGPDPLMKMSMFNIKLVA